MTIAATTQIKMAITIADCIRIKRLPVNSFELDDSFSIFIKILILPAQKYYELLPFFLG
jgi:hypothetical protein